MPSSARSLYTLLEDGQPTLLFPGGLEEAYRSTKRNRRVDFVGWPDDADACDFARIAARFDATIVAVAAVGADESFATILDADELRRLPFVGHRFGPDGTPTPPLAVPLPPQRYYFAFGSPTRTKGVDHADRRACAALYRDVRAELEGGLQFLREGQERDRYRHCVPRLAFEVARGWKEQAPTFR